MDFNRAAINWDTEERIVRGEVIANEIRNNLESESKEVALEFGCGTGLIGFNLRDFFKEIILVDISEEMIEVVQNKIKLLGSENIKAICNNIIDFDENSKFDFIYSSMALHHIINIEELLDKFYRLLNSKGKLCIVDLNEDDGRFHGEENDFVGHNGFSQNRLGSICAGSGFHNIHTYTFYYDKKKVKGEEVHYSLFIMICEK